MWRQAFISLVILVVWTSKSVSGGRKARLKVIQASILNIKKETTEMKNMVAELRDLMNEKCNEPMPQVPPMSLKKMVLDDEGYYLAFRMTAGIGKSAYDRYTEIGCNDDDNPLIADRVPCMCKCINGSHYCDRHYRSVLLDLWPRLPVEMVRVAVYMNGVRMMYLDFDGKDTNYLNFFKQSKLLQNPYVDLMSASPNHFSIAGDTDIINATRRFFINNNYGNCVTDAGWLAVGDRPSPSACTWEWDPNCKYPYILYSKGKEMAVWETGNVSMADVLTISIKLAEKQGCAMAEYPSPGDQC